MAALFPRSFKFQSGVAAEVRANTASFADDLPLILHAWQIAEGCICGLGAFQEVKLETLDVREGPDANGVSRW